MLAPVAVGGGEESVGDEDDGGRVQVEVMDGLDVSLGVGKLITITRRG